MRYPILLYAASLFLYWLSNIGICASTQSQTIIQDVRFCIQENRTPVILTKLKKHTKLLYDALSEEADRVFLFYGDNTQTQNQEIRRAMRDTPREKTMIVVATGQKIGEGFDCPRLNTLMLASPVKFDGRLIQYVGRLNRTYEGKTNVICSLRASFSLTSSYALCISVFFSERSTTRVNRGRTSKSIPWACACKISNIKINLQFIGELNVKKFFKIKKTNSKDNHSLQKTHRKKNIVIALLYTKKLF